MYSCSLQPYPPPSASTLSFLSSCDVFKHTTKCRGSPKKKDSPKRMHCDHSEMIRDGMEDMEGEGPIGVMMLTETVSIGLLSLVCLLHCIYRSG